MFFLLMHRDLLIRIGVVLPVTLGLLLGKPTIGAAKSRLIGTPVERDGETFLVDKEKSSVPW